MVWWYSMSEKVGIVGRHYVRDRSAGRTQKPVKRPWGDLKLHKNIAQHNFTSILLKHVAPFVSNPGRNIVRSDDLPCHSLQHGCCACVIRATDLTRCSISYAGRNYGLVAADSNTQFRNKIPRSCSSPCHCASDAAFYLPPRRGRRRSPIRRSFFAQGKLSRLL